MEALLRTRRRCESRRNLFYQRLNQQFLTRLDVHLTPQLMIETVLPSLKKTGFDKIPSVRKALITCLVKTLTVALSHFDFNDTTSNHDDKMIIDGEATLRETGEETTTTNKSNVYAPFVPQLLSFLLGLCCDEVEDVKKVAIEELRNLAEERKEESIFKFQGDEGGGDITSKVRVLLDAHNSQYLLLLLTSFYALLSTVRDVLLREDPHDSGNRR